MPLHLRCMLVDILNLVSVIPFVERAHAAEWIRLELPAGVVVQITGPWTRPDRGERLENRSRPQCVDSGEVRVVLAVYHQSLRANFDLALLLGPREFPLLRCFRQSLQQDPGFVQTTVLIVSSSDLIGVQACVEVVFLFRLERVLREAQSTLLLLDVSSFTS